MIKVEIHDIKKSNVVFSIISLHQKNKIDRPIVRTHRLQLPSTRLETGSFLFLFFPFIFINLRFGRFHGANYTNVFAFSDKFVVGGRAEVNRRSEKLSKTMIVHEEENKGS